MRIEYDPSVDVLMIYLREGAQRPLKLENSAQPG